MQRSRQPCHHHADKGPDPRSKDSKAVTPTIMTSSGWQQTPIVRAFSVAGSTVLQARFSSNSYNVRVFRQIYTAQMVKHDRYS